MSTHELESKMISNLLEVDNHCGIYSARKCAVCRRLTSLFIFQLKRLALKTETIFGDRNDLIIDWEKLTIDELGMTVPVINRRTSSEAMIIIPSEVMQREAKKWKKRHNKHSRKPR